MTEFGTLTSLMNGLRLMATILATAVLVSWSPSFARVVGQRERDGDGARAIWVTLAFSVLLFQARWLYPNFDDLTRMRVWVVAQAAMVATLMSAIYHHGASQAHFHLRRTMIVHLAMVVLCIVITANVR